ncbi:MAG: hypothetical protein A3B67_06255 [Burkholderiales bacterium RIFCSPHIGHO2_02_FULL_66_10]|nr:MAG: hypothetical protein A3B67_06255 [Burkholderiales bacterium RIFCSPHIGHO2_02_FULL_66_10]
MSVSDTSRLCEAASSVNFCITWATRSCDTARVLAMVSPSFCTSFGLRCLNTSAASSSPSDMRKIAASWIPWSSMIVFP